MLKQVLVFLLQFSLLSPAWSAAAQAPQAAAPTRKVHAAKAGQEASRRFAALAEDYWDTQMRLSPLEATFVGYPKYNDRLDDIGAAGRAEENRELTRLLKGLQAIERSALSEREQVSYDILKLELERGLEAERHMFWQWNIDHMDGAQSWIPSTIALAQPMNTAEDAEGLLVRMKTLPAYFASHVSNLREGITEGRVAARVPVEKTISQLEGLIKTPADQSPYAEAGKRLPAELQSQYLPKIIATVSTHVYPAYRQYLDFLRTEYLERARKDKIGLSDLPGGAEAYRYYIRFHTTVDKSPEEIHQMGLEELQSIRGEMREIARKLGNTGDLNAFLDQVRHDPKNFFKTREEVLNNAKDLVARAKAKLPEFFGRLPKTPLVVQPIEEYKEKNDVAARYYPPSDDLKRPGIYYINTYQPQTRLRFGMASLAAHEGVPGHHLQVAIGLEIPGLPTFRRHGDFTSFIEGWALYTERLAEEMGLYQDDLSRLGMLSDQSFRASRLAVDTGIHALGWSRQKAIDFMKANTLMSQEEIVAEVDRYTIWPGQALAYKVGQREIMAIRREAQARLGSRFDIRKFHDQVLKNGAVPLTVLREQVLGSL